MNHSNEVESNVYKTASWNGSHIESIQEEDDVSLPCEEAKHRQNSEPRWGYLLTQVVDTGQGIEERVLNGLCTMFNKTDDGILKS